MSGTRRNTDNDGECDCNERREASWHTSKSLAITIIMALAINTFSMVWWASGINSDVTTLKARPDLTERVVMLEAGVSEQGRLLNRLTDVLDRLDGKLDAGQKDLTSHVVAGHKQ